VFAPFNYFVVTKSSGRCLLFHDVAMWLLLSSVAFVSAAIRYKRSICLHLGVVD